MSKTKVRQQIHNNKELFPMARKIKDSRRFGLPSGRYRSGRRCIRMNSGKVKTLYQCNLKGGSNMTKLCIRKQPKRSAYNRVRINLLRRSTKKQYQVFRTINGELKTFEVQNVAANGYRIINLNCLQKHITDLTMHAVSCEKARQLVAAGREPIVLESQVAHYGLAVILLAKCQGCQLKVHMETSPKLKTDGSRHYDINVRAVWGSIVSGNGLAHLNEQLASMDSPTMSQNTYQVIENEINSWWKEVVEREMSVAIEEEKKIAIDKNRYHEGIPSVTVICDGGWSKRSHKHTYNALGGVAVIIGAETKKILHVGIRNKYCYICNRNESLGTTPKQHECFKNWNQSSQSMESDVIVEGFLKANDHGIRYMNFIADGDSSMHAQIMDRVPVWGKHVKKLECANHITKCLRSNLEKLVTENPSYKGKGKLCKRTRVRIVSAVRCAIRKRSDETNRVLATKKLDHDIRNTTSHIYGDHKLCNPDFCKAKSNMSHQDQNQDDDSEVECEDIFQEQSEFWDAGTSLQAQEDSRGHYNLEPSDLQLGMRQDLSLLLNNVAKKSSSLIGNFTTNLAECWMHIRSKFDGGKMLNHCNRGAWHTRCYAGALRFNIGPNWSPNVWAQTTETTSGLYFDKLYKQREQCIDNNNKSKDKKEIKERRWKRKMSSVKESNSSKAKEHYGIESIQPESDVSENELTKLKYKFLQNNIEITTSKIIQIEKDTKSQVCSEKWKKERKKRVTASNFGNVFKRKPSIKVTPLVLQLLYSNFKGNKATRIGLREERITIQEYINIKAKDNIEITVEPCGLIIDKTFKYLAASPDGKVIDKQNNEIGLIEIKNLVHDKNLTLTQAATSLKNFCLEKVSSGTNTTLRLKNNHNYFYQCQGLLHICDSPWIDFVVRTLNPYDIFIQRIERNTTLWKKMVAKLTAFYDLALLPEIASPRHKKYPGIREPGNWYADENNTKKKTPSLKKKGGKRKDCTTDDEEAQGPSIKCNLNDHKKTIRRTRRKCSQLKFLGRRISHEWIEEDNNSKWYSGTVTGVLTETDGADGAEYEVLYDGDDEPHIIDHLLEDYRSCSLKFIDL